MQQLQQRSRRIAPRIVFWLVLLVILCFFLLPPIWLFLTSIKTFNDAFAMPPKLFFKPTLRENYRNVLQNKSIQNYLFNSIIVSGLSTLLALMIGVPGGYALAMYEFRAKNNLSFFILSVRIAPPIMSLFPLFMIFSRTHLVGTKAALVIMYVVFNLPLTVWIMQIFFRDISREYPGGGVDRRFLRAADVLEHHASLDPLVLRNEHPLHHPVVERVPDRPSC